MLRYLLCLGLLIATGQLTQAADPLPLKLRYRQETAEGTGRFHTLQREENWAPEKTALILCDVWDTHTCRHAAMRVEELVPRLNKVVEFARQQGVTIIHAPSGCMNSYATHPARLRAQQVPGVATYPEEIAQWCYQIPSEERGVYPLDQSDGGCDDEAQEHADWSAKLVAEGRNPKGPWLFEHATISIDGERDFISDQGKEVWNILSTIGIDHVILAGVHTNMCVLGRPFGLRQMARNGKNVVLLRDMTDTMYNPAMRPFVSHFTGTDLIIEHIEKFVCPTITSEQLIGGAEFRFQNDHRPHLAVLCAEDEYRTEESLPKYALEELGHDYRVSFVFGSETDKGDLPGLFALDTADALLVSVRRRPLQAAELAQIQKYVRSGKPVIGIRTASHAFCLRNQPAPEGLADWPEFDPEVFGGHYTNHHGNNLQTTVHVTGGGPVLEGIDRADFAAGGSLYKTSPLASGTTVLLTGTVEGAEAEPVAWTFQRAGGGKSFYTSLGHVADFEQPAFRQLLKNGIKWALSK